MVEVYCGLVVEHGCLAKPGPGVGLNRNGKIDGAPQILVVAVSVFVGRVNLCETREA